MVLDYRCVVPGGELGTKLPPGVQQCLRSIAKAPLAELCQRYGFPGGLPAVVLKQRAVGAPPRPARACLVARPAPRPPRSCLNHHPAHRRPRPRACSPAPPPHPPTPTPTLPPADLLDKGLEWTLANGEPRNSEKLTREPQPPCCKTQRTHGGFFCASCWEPLMGPNATYNHFSSKGQQLA